MKEADRKSLIDKLHQTSGATGKGGVSSVVEPRRSGRATATNSALKRRLQTIDEVPEDGEDVKSIHSAPSKRAKSKASLTTKVESRPWQC
jgi:hypothetical protein